MAVLHAIGIWNESILPTIYLTNKNYYPITRWHDRFPGRRPQQWLTLAAAGSLDLMTLPMVIIFLVLQRYIVSGLTQGAVKG